MKAVVWKGKYALEYTDLPEPECRPGWVKIKVMAVGLCATDVHIIADKFDAGKPPHVLGHEICGDIVAVGDGCDKSLCGKRVVVETYVGCGTCEFCRTGRKHLCSAGEIGYPPYQGGEAQFVTVPVGCIREIPDSISYDEGAIIEAVACPFGALLNSGFQMGQTVLIQGVGVAGLSFIQAARAAGAGRIFCTARNDVRAAMARKFGAEVIDLRTDDAVAYIQRETGGRGVDLAIDAAGAPATIEQCFQAVVSGGMVMLYGIPSKEAVIPLPVTECILRQIRVCGYTGNEWGWDPLIQLVDRGVISLKEMVSVVMPLSRTSEAVALLESRDPHIVKVVLHPWDDNE
ncbi:MAG: alcohol dehydrogenase catalytic domain-containing protein [Clostridia bacterium]|nr:alcohol dehydrogenase catalytic domain-containing protein [Clostridia bacterium]